LRFFRDLGYELFWRNVWEKGDFDALGIRT
jgi:hypothetical protein